LENGEGESWDGSGSGSGSKETGLNFQLDVSHGKIREKKMTQDGNFRTLWEVLKKFCTQSQKYRSDANGWFA
jgi:hypothetical protein